jgi:hypothetical protein
MARRLIRLRARDPDAGLAEFQCGEQSNGTSTDYNHSVQRFHVASPISFHLQGMARHPKVKLRVAGIFEPSVTSRIDGGNANQFANREQTDRVFSRRTRAQGG